MMRETDKKKFVQLLELGGNVFHIHREPTPVVYPDKMEFSPSLTVAKCPKKKDAVADVCKISLFSRRHLLQSQRVTYHGLMFLHLVC